MNHVFVIFIAIFLISFSSCNSMKGNKPKGVNKDSLLFSSNFQNATGLFLKGNFAEAQTLYNNCIAINGKSAVSYYQLSRIARELNNNELALSNSLMACQLNSENVWYQLLHASNLKYDGKILQAIDIYKKIINKYPDNIVYKINLSLMYSSIGKYQEAINMIDLVENIVGFTEEIGVYKYKYYINLNDLKKTEYVLYKLNFQFPEKDIYRELIVDFLLAKNDFEKSNIFIEKNIRSFSSVSNFYYQKYKYFKAVKHTDSTFYYQKKFFEDSKFDPLIKSKELLSAFSDDGTVFNYDKVHLIELCNILQKFNNNLPESYLIISNFSMADGNTEESIKNLLICTKNAPASFECWQQLIQVLVQVGDYDRLRIHSARALDYFPDQPFFYLYLGIGQLSLGYYSEAIQALKSGLLYIVDNPFLESQFYFNLGEAYFKNKDKFNCYKYFEKTIALDQNNRFALHNYSYYLALNNDSLNLADVLIKKCISLDFANPNYYYTQALILFKLNEFNQAKVMLSKAFNIAGESNYVWCELYGDILKRLGNLIEARKYWERSINLGNKNLDLNTK